MTFGSHPPPREDPTFLAVPCDCSWVPPRCTERLSFGAGRPGRELGDRSDGVAGRRCARARGGSARLSSESAVHGPPAAQAAALRVMRFQQITESHAWVPVRRDESDSDGPQAMCGNAGYWPTSGFGAQGRGFRAQGGWWRPRALGSAPGRLGVWLAALSRVCGHGRLLSGYVRGCWSLRSRFWGPGDWKSRGQCHCRVLGTHQNLPPSGKGCLGC